MRASLHLATALLAVVLDVSAGGEPLGPKDAEAARKLYVGKCAKCHRFHDPKDYSESDWRKWMDAMGRKSKLKPKDTDVLSRYLDAYRAGQLPGKPQDKPPAK